MGEQLDPLHHGVHVLGEGSAQVELLQPLESLKSFLSRPQAEVGIVTIHDLMTSKSHDHRPL